MCHQCGRPSYQSCNCRRPAPYRQAEPCCNNDGCPVKLDFDCVIYHQSNKSANKLVNLGLTNGVTLGLFAETVDEWIGLINTDNWTLTCLADLGYDINNIEQFGNAVSNQFCEIQTQIEEIIATASVEIEASSTPSITINTSGPLNHTINAEVNISASGNNQLVELEDGLYALPQTLSIDYENKLLTISDGNTVDFSSLVCGVGGFLGNVDADPTGPQDGQYWFRTDGAAATGLKIRLNGATRTITTS